MLGILFLLVGISLLLAPAFVPLFMYVWKKVGVWKHPSEKNTVKAFITLCMSLLLTYIFPIGAMLIPGLFGVLVFWIWGDASNRFHQTEENGFSGYLFRSTGAIALIGLLFLIIGGATCSLTPIHIQ